MLIFLDYDGVLHPNEVYQIPGRGIVLTTDGHNLFEYTDLLAVALKGHPDVRIVLSTSWVRTIGFKKSKARLPTCLQERVIGSCWHSSLDQYYWNTLTRYEQISMYVTRHQVQNWLAIDDDDYKWPDNKRQHLIHTDEQGGLGRTAGALDNLILKLEYLKAG
jgi:hypothetical protein